MIGDGVELVAEERGGVGKRSLPGSQSGAVNFIAGLLGCASVRTFWRSQIPMIANGRRP
jgi:hypothetical protein